MPASQPVPLFHRQWGPSQGVPLVLLHGFPLSSEMWDSVGGRLGEAGVRVLAPDLRGHGKTPDPGTPVTVETYASDVAAWLDGLGIREFLLGGFSLGGYVAFALASMRPERIPALLLASTRAEPDSDEGRKARKETAGKIAASGMGVVADQMIPKFFTAATAAKQPTLLARVRAQILANPPAGAIHALEAMAARPDRRGFLEGWRAPTLLVVGDADELTPPRASQAMADVLPNAQLRIIAEAAHLVPMERPQEFSRTVLEWRSRLPSSAGPTAARASPK